MAKPWGRTNSASHPTIGVDVFDVIHEAPVRLAEAVVDFGSVFVFLRLGDDFPRVAAMLSVNFPKLLHDFFLFLSARLSLSATADR